MARCRCPRLTTPDVADGGVVVMGPTAIAPYIGGGGSAHVTPYDPAQGPYDALTAAAGPHSNLSYVPGYDLDGQVAAARRRCPRRTRRPDTRTGR